MCRWYIFIFCVMKYNQISQRPNQRVSQHSNFVIPGSQPLGRAGANFWNKQGPTVLVLNIKDIAFHGCSEIIQNTNFTIFTVHATIFEQFAAEWRNNEETLESFIPRLYLRYKKVPIWTCPRPPKPQPIKYS